MTPTGQDEWLELMMAQGEWPAKGERRKSIRVPLHWTLHLACQGGKHPHRTEIKNLSRDGFYCFLHEPLTAGEHVDCDIVVPTHAPDCEDVLFLRCRAQVIRVEKVDCGERYGMACRIKDYQVIHPPPKAALASISTVLN
jgi:hypothetical protein